MKQKLEYINISSPIHKLNPTFKIFYFILFVIIALLPHNLDYIVLANCILGTYLIICSKVPLKFYLHNIWQVKLIIVAMFIILASFNYTLISAFLLVLSFVIAVCLYCLIIYTTSLFERAMGIYNIIKHFNFINYNSNVLFIKIYNLMCFKKDYEYEENKKIEALEIKGQDIRHQNILKRFSYKVNLCPEIIKNVKKYQKKRKEVILRHKFNVQSYYSLAHFADFIYLLLFGLLIFIYISKVM